MDLKLFERKLERKVITVERKERKNEKQELVAELCIDRVSFNILRNRKQKVSYYNIEIEDKDLGDAADLSDILTSLTSDKKFKKKLKLWPYSKLATVKTIEKLVNLGKIKLPVCKGSPVFLECPPHNLTPADFIILEGALSN